MYYLFDYQRLAFAWGLTLLVVVLPWLAYQIWRLYRPKRELIAVPCDTPRLSLGTLSVWTGIFLGGLWLCAWLWQVGLLWLAERF